MARVLVTGAAGFIGSHAASRLAERGDRVVGLDNFNDNLIDPVWWNSVKVTAILALSAVAVEFILGLLLALAMLRPFRGRRILMVLVVIPLFISPVVAR